MTTLSLDMNFSIDPSQEVTYNEYALAELKELLTLIESPHNQNYAERIKNFSAKLKICPLIIDNIDMWFLFPRIPGELKVGIDAKSNVSVHPNNTEYIMLHGHSKKTENIYMFVPLAGEQAFRYAHQKMVDRFGQICFLCAFNSVIDKTYAVVVDNIAIRTTSIFGLHVTISVTEDPLLENLTQIAQCQAQCQSSHEWSSCLECEVKDPVIRAHIDDFDDANLILLLLDLVTKFSDKPDDCFKSAYYSYVLAEFIKNNPNHFTKEEFTTYIEQLLNFGNDDIILSLIIKSANYLNNPELTISISSYFDLEIIQSLARQIAKKRKEE